MEKIWLDNYPPGVPAEITLDEGVTLVSLFEEACRKYSAQVAYVSMGKSMTYRELDQLSLDFAGWLQASGLKKGDRIALMMPNVLQYPVALFGALRAGCVVVSCNPLYTARELGQQLVDSGAVAIVVVENFAHVVEACMGKSALKHIVVTPVGELLGFPKSHLVNFVIRKVKKLVPAWSIPNVLSFKAALAIGKQKGMSPVAIGKEDLAFLQYTGGTTGVSKGAMLLHRNITANVLQAYQWIKPAIREGEECIITALPLYHIFALTANCLTFLTAGAKNLLILNPRDMGGFIKEWRKYPVSVVTGVNTLFNALLSHPDFARVDFSTLKVALGGGMAVQGTVAKQWAAVTGTPLLEAYGLTETSPAATMNPLNLKAFNGSIGLPISSTECQIRNDDGQELPQGEIGEICIRGPQVMSGYWQRPDETALVMTDDGFLRTGDMGYIDSGGFVFLADRKKDMILVSGFNVYPKEVEEVVAMHPGVSEVAAVGVQDEKSGEAVKIFVVPKQEGLSADELIRHCRTQLTAYKVPRFVEFRTDLPKTNVGKILRRALKEPKAS